MTLGGVAFWIAVPEYWEEFKNMLNGIDPNIIPLGLLSLIIIAGVVFVYDYRTRKDGTIDHKEICQNIHTELKDGIESLDGTLPRKTRQHEINGKKIIYKHIYMNHNTFDGYVNSGEFNIINRELQQPIQDIYKKIEIHDEYVKKCKSDPIDNNDVLTLNQYEKELLKEIPLVMEDLKKYF